MGCSESLLCIGFIYTLVTIALEQAYETEDALLVAMPNRAKRPHARITPLIQGHQHSFLFVG